MRSSPEPGWPCTASDAPTARPGPNGGARCPVTVSSRTRRSWPPTRSRWPRRPKKSGPGWCRWVGTGPGWYTARWVDLLLFPQNLPSADRVVPELQHLDVGDVVPDGPPDSRCGFVVVEEEPLRHLVLRSTSHLPLSWRRRGIAGVDWTWAFVLVPVTGGTRLVFRWRAHARPWWLTLGAHALLLPADFMMSRDMLRGISARAAPVEPGRTPPLSRTADSSAPRARVAHWG